MAELAKIPLRSYQKAESNQLPRPDNRRALAKAFDVPESRLYLDPDLESPNVAISPRLQLLELAASLNDSEAEFLLASAQNLGPRPWPGLQASNSSDQTSKRASNSNKSNRNNR